MIIKPDSTIVVYISTKQEYHRSVYSKFEILYPEHKMIGYIEDLGVLCCGHETAYYDMSSYVNDIMYSDFQEMTYDDYLRYYKGILEKDNPAAPLLNESSITFGNFQVNEVDEPSQARQILNSNPVLNNLHKNGVKVQILKG